MQSIPVSELLSSNSDSALARRFAAEASAEAFAALVGRYHGLVHGTARRILHDDEAARDVVQDVFVRLARDARRIRPEALAAWLHRTARNAALNFHRGEARRRRREQTMSDHLNAMAAPDAGEIPDHWASALEHLDAALDGLSEAERQCVIERYHQERPLRDIAASAGKSEDAARMTINRALEKMSGFLRRRGVAFSVTGLAAGLTAEFSRAAPALSGTAAASLTSAALTAAKSPGAGSGLAFFTTAIMTKTTGIIGAAALVFLLAMGGGWLANRPASPAGGSELQAETMTKSRPGAAESAPAKPSAGRLGATPADSRVAGVIARLAALRVKRMEITGRVPRNADTPPDPNVTNAALKEMEALESAAHVVLGELDSASLPESVALALKLDGPTRDFLISQLFGRWGTLDPDKAMAAAKELPFSLQDTGRGAIARGWGRHDPQAALAASQRLNPGDERARMSFLSEVFTGWLHADAAAAVRALPGLPVDDQRVAARSFDDIAKLPSQRAAATIEIAALTDEVLRAEVAKCITADWARFDGPAAAAWLDALPWDNPGSSLEAAGKLMENWARNRDQTAPALDWFWPKVPAELRPEILERFVAGKWAKADRAAAEAWLAKHGIATSDVPKWERHTP